MINLPPNLLQKLEGAARLNQRRILKLRGGLDFASNDYLGFAQDKTLVGLIKSELASVTTLGSTGSRLLRGQLEVFENLEKELAGFCQRQEALFFATGYQANLALYSSLLSSDDIVFSDELNHASIIDGIRLSRARCEIIPHNDIQALARALEKYREFKGIKVVATESLFSMEGDEAPLREVSELCEREGALLVVDEAHSTGLYQSGVVQKYGLQDKVFASVHTGGKSLGVGGAWIATSSQFKDFLINFSRPFIFSTAPQPFLAHSLRIALQYWKSEGALRATKLFTNFKFVFEKLESESHRFNFSTPQNISGPILPIVLGDNARTLNVASAMEKRGYDVRAIRPPTVPEGTARLRLTINCNHDENILSEMVKNLVEVLEEAL